MQGQRKYGVLATGAIIALLSFLPAAYASTLTVQLNPSTKAAVMTSTSVTNIVFTYPAKSSISSYLNGYADNTSASGSFPGGSQGVTSFEHQFHDDGGSQVSVTNMTVSTNYSAKANSTTLMISKHTTISATVSGVFNIVNGSVTANLGWRAFRIIGALNLPLEGRVYDVNLVGSSVSLAMGDRYSESSSVLSLFGSASLWNAPTLNFSSLNSPLSSWTKNYDSVSNTTTFSKTISGSSSLSVSETFNGQTYSLKATSDPSAVIKTTGYADASANDLTIVPTPLYLSPITWAEVGFFVGLVALAGFALARSMRRKTNGVRTALQPQ